MILFIKHTTKVTFEEATFHTCVNLIRINLLTINDYETRGRKEGRATVSPTVPFKSWPLILHHVSEAVETRTLGTRGKSKGA